MSIWYISPSGNDSTGNGSIGTPWATISKAHTSASAGDTIICKDGTYTWASQTFTKSLTIQSENDGLAVFNGGGTNISWTASSSITLALSGLIFEDATSGGNTGSGRIFCVSGGITFSLTISRCVLRDLTVFDISGWPGSIFMARGTMIVSIISCAIYDIVETNANQSALFAQFVSGALTVTITNCIFYNDLAAVPYVAYRSTATLEFVVKNTIFYTSVARAWQTGTPTYTGSGSNLIYGYTSPAAIYTLSTDPLFYDAASGNFGLRPTSPCLNAGTLV